jgi:hypothetical protein
MSIAIDNGAVRQKPELEDPRDRDRQVADIVARLCAKRRNGETPTGALRAALADSSAPARDEVAAVVAQSCEDGREWMKTSAELHRLARRWRSPLLATLADAFSDGGYALNVDYLQALAIGTGVEQATPPALALKRMKHPRHGVSWSDDEDSRLRAAFEQGLPVAELAERHQRNENAIRARLLKLGVIEDDRPGA